MRTRQDDFHCLQIKIGGEFRFGYFSRISSGANIGTDPLIVLTPGADEFTSVKALPATAGIARAGDPRNLLPGFFVRLDRRADDHKFIQQIEPERRSERDGSRRQKPAKSGIKR
jgi:hypothetical protein